MESNTRYNLLAKVEDTRDYLKRLSDFNNDFGSDKLTEEISKYRDALEFIERFAQNNNENECLDMENFDLAYNEAEKEFGKFKGVLEFIYQNNAETMILDKVLVAENEYLTDKKQEGKYFLHIEKISNTSKQLNNRIIKILAGCLDKEYSKNFSHTGEKLHDNYSDIILKETTATKKHDLVSEIKVTIGEKCVQFRQGTKNFQQEERYNKLLQLMDAVNDEFNSIGTQKKYDATILHNFKKLAEELEGQRVSGEINLEDAQKQRDQLIWEMGQLKEHIANAKNEILISETIANVNKTKEQVAKMKEMGYDVELIDIYSKYTNAHLDNLQNAAEQMHYLNKEELLQEIGNIKTENIAFQQEVEQKRNQEQ